MSDYLVYTTTELASNSQDNQLEEFLSNFECQINLDIQNFVRNKAIDFEKRGIAVTHLVFLGHTNDFVGFFTLAIKILEVNVQSMSKSLAKRLARFGEIEEDNTIKIPAILIAQFGKNLSADIEKPISGVELMELALAYVTKAQSIVVGASSISNAKTTKTFLASMKLTILLSLMPAKPTIVMRLQVHAGSFSLHVICTKRS